jgi:hypothetical protein
VHGPCLQRARLLAPRLASLGPAGLEEFQQHPRALLRRAAPQGRKKVTAHLGHRLAAEPVHHRRDDPAEAERGEKFCPKGPDAPMFVATPALQHLIRHFAPPPYSKMR